MASVRGFVETRQPFAASPFCPACRNAKGDYFTFRFCAVRYMRAGADAFGVHKFSEPPDHHLRVTCNRCGFWWEMEVAQP